LKTPTGRRKLIAVAIVAALAAVTVPPTAVSANEGTTLVVPVNQSPWTNAYRALVAEYTKKTGVKIDLRVFPYDELRTQMLNDIKAGTNTFDVYQMDEVFLHEFFSNGWVKPLRSVDPNFKMDPAINSYAGYSYWNARTKTSDAKNGVPMVLPLNGNVQLLMYRKDILQKLNLPVPKTWAETLSHARKIQASGEAKYGYAIRTQASTGGSAAVYDFSSIMYAYGANWFTKEGTDWTPSVNSKEFIAAARMYRALARTGPEATSTIGQAQVIAALQRGEAGMGQVVAAAAAQMNNPDASVVAGKIGFAPLPAGPKRVGVTSGTWGLGVPAGLSSVRSKAAYDYINWVLSKEAQIIFTEAGGIPTRNDVIPAAKVTGAQREYLNAVQGSLKNISSSVRYIFAAPMLLSSEQRLAAIAAGTLTPEAGTQKLFFDLQKVVSDYDFQMKQRASAKKITCVKGKLTRTVTGTNPKCPAGYKIKK
jgi:multiple sugar transport system substrate-binding protein